jgi:hypothetical protein
LCMLHLLYAALPSRPGIVLVRRPAGIFPWYSEILPV